MKQSVPILLFAISFLSLPFSAGSEDFTSNPNYFASRQLIITDSSGFSALPGFQEYREEIGASKVSYLCAHNPTTPLTYAQDITSLENSESLTTVGISNSKPAQYPITFHIVQYDDQALIEITASHLRADTYHYPLPAEGVSCYIPPEGSLD